MNSEIVDGRYRLKRQIGQSSMEEVWLALDLELERPVALKLRAPDAERAASSGRLAWSRPSAIRT